jgi:membrane associated rhomboid family serine protease
MYNDSFFDSVKMGFMRLPNALRWVLLINISMFLVQALLDLFGLTVVNAFLIQWLALSPSGVENLMQPWRLVTYMFLHAHGFHILFNMLWLWWMGRPVEDTLGSRNFTVLFLGAGIGGGLIHVMLASVFGAAVTIGASGAVFGMMVCFAMLYPTQPIMLLFLPPIEARYLVAGLIVLDVLFLNAADNVARVVHLGGALSGYLLMKGYYRGYNYHAWVGAIVDRYAFLFRSRSGPRSTSGSGSGSGSRKSSSSGASSTYSSSGRARNPKMRAVADAEILEEVENTDQVEMDRILDKISKDGYASLTAEEKRILFELSKKK